MMVEAICLKLTPQILDQLLRAPQRTLELKRRTDGISLKILVQRLRRLQRLGFVARSSAPGYPLEIRYALTARGETMASLYGALADMGIPFDLLAGLFKRAWTMGLVRQLFIRPQRPSVLRRRQSGISKKVLYQRLHDLEACGLVRREVSPGSPIAVLYRLDDNTRRLYGFVESLVGWRDAESGKIIDNRPTWH